MLRILFILTVFIPLLVKGQDIGKRINFTEYLINQNFYKETIYESKQILQLKLSQPQRDSIYYFKGWAEYNLKELKESSQSLLMVSHSSTFYPKSQLFGTYNLIFIREFDQSIITLNNFKENSERDQNFSNFLRSGIYLLQRDLSSFQKIKQKLPAEYYGFSKELAKLSLIADELENRKSKSPVKAGIFSGLLPGSGQIYSGKTGQGVAAFLMSSGLALVTLENLNKRGPEKFETIFFGSVFTVFYIGNIYGAVFSAKIANNEYNELTDKQILFNLHIPLRNIFN